MCLSRKGAAGRSGPEADDLGNSAEGELLGQTGETALGEQRGEAQEHLFQVMLFPLLSSI